MRAFFLFSLGVIAAQASALDLTGVTGPLSFNDGLGNTATATIEHLSSSAPELDRMYNSLALSGYTFDKLPDQAGTIDLQEAYIDGFHYDSGYRLIGFRVLSQQTFTGGGAPLFWGEWDTVTYDDGSGFSAFDDRTEDSTFPFIPTNTSDTISSHFAWGNDKPHYVNNRYFFFGQTIDDGIGGFTAQITDGFKVTLDVHLTPQAVPEPGTYAVLGLGAAALLRRRKKTI